jgi:hypothetical protein
MVVSDISYHQYMESHGVIRMMMQTDCIFLDQKPSNRCPSEDFWLSDGAPHSKRSNTGFTIHPKCCLNMFACLKPWYWSMNQCFLVPHFQDPNFYFCAGRCCAIRWACFRTVRTAWVWCETLQTLWFWRPEAPASKEFQEKNLHYGRPPVR